MEEALQYTQLITNIIIIILFIGLIIIVFRLISTIRNISARVEKLTSSVLEIKPKVEKAIEKINGVTDNVNSFVVKINENVQVLTSVVDKFKIMAEGIIEFEQKVQKKIEPPVFDTVNTISALSIGVKTFFDRMKQSKQKKLLNEGNDFSEIVSEQLEDINKELEEVNEKLTNMQK